MIEVELTQGFKAVVDDQDGPLVLPFKWYALRSDKTVYAQRRQGHAGVFISMHGLILPPPAGFQIDHKDGDGLNNTRSNLRICTQAENNRNRSKFSSGTSRFIGVNWNQQKQKWQCRIRVNQKDVHLGWFADEVEAAHHYDFAAIQCVGPFARLNFPEAA